MSSLRSSVFLLATATFLQSCFLVGIHTKMPNPDKQGKIPSFSEEEILLGELTESRSCFDVKYYNLDIELLPEDKALKGEVVMLAEAVADFEMFQLDLASNLEVIGIKDSETNTPLNFSRKERALFIKRTTGKGDLFSVRVSYYGKPVIARKPPWKGGFVWEKDKNKKAWVGVACESDGASLWWPCKDHTSDEPDSIDLHYTVPKDLVAVGNGQLFEVDTLLTADASGKLKYHWKVSNPINAYNVTVYVGNFKELNSTYEGINGKSLTLTHYVLPENYEKAQNHFQQLDSMLLVFEQSFGEYPWYQDGFKLIESPYAGMEHQSAIAYGNGYKNNLFKRYDYILLHETAHEWWGNSVSAADLADVWLQEGFATYAEYIFLENTGCENCARSHLGFYRLLIKNKYPVVGIKDRRWFHFRKNSDVYMKGAWILHTLRNQIDDDELFIDILRSFHETYKYQIVTSQDFIDHVNMKTGSDYNWFFNQYLVKNQVPEFHFSWINGRFIYWWEKVEHDFDKLAVELDLGSEVIKITPSTRRQVESLTGITRLHIDRDILMKSVQEK